MLKILCLVNGRQNWNPGYSNTKSQSLNHFSSYIIISSILVSTLEFGDVASAQSHTVSKRQKGPANLMFSDFKDRAIYGRNSLCRPPFIHPKKVTDVLHHLDKTCKPVFTVSIELVTSGLLSSMLAHFCSQEFVCFQELYSI